MPKCAKFNPTELPALADGLREGWRPGSQITRLQRDDDAFPVEWKPSRTLHPTVADSGFTLIEILIALAILSMALAIILGSFQLGLKSIEDAADRSECLAVAEAILAAEGVLTPLAVGEETGSTANGDRWSVTVRPWRTHDDTNAQLLTADDIDVTVTRNRVSVTLSTLYARPVTNGAQ